VQLLVDIRSETSVVVKVKVDVCLCPSWRLSGE